MDLAGFMSKWDSNEVCIDHIFLLQYPDRKGVCHKCDRATTFYRTQDPKVYVGGYKCAHTMSPLANTMFRYTHVPLPLWFATIYLLVHAPDFLSISKLQRILGLDENTASRLLQRVRRADDPGYWIRGAAWKA